MGVGGAGPGGVVANRPGDRTLPKPNITWACGRGRGRVTWAAVQIYQKRRWASASAERCNIQDTHEAVMTKMGCWWSAWRPCLRRGVVRSK